jgi:hypothetical protein
VNTPRDWCHRVLAAIRQHHVQRRDVGSLETLLSYFIELDPPTETFDALLAQYAGDSRVDIARAATHLQGAWRRAQVDTARPPALPLQETLRTFGALLDQWGTRNAYVAVSAEAPRMSMFGEGRQQGELRHLSLGPPELAQEVAARTALRGHVAPADPTDPSRFETRLRAIGADLDGEAPQAYELVVTRRTIVIEGSANYYRVCTADALLPQLQTLVGQRHPEAS